MSETGKTPSSGELFRTSKGVTYQCDNTDRIIVHFDGIVLSFRIHEFINFRRQLNQIDIKSRLFDLSDEYDHHVLEAPQLNYNKQLTLCELIQFRDLLNGTYFAIELNSLLCRVLDYPGELV